MSDEVKEVLASAAEPWQKGIKLVDRLFDAAQPSVVYGEPIVCDGKTVVTASEVSVAMGFGYGAGAGSGGGVPEEGLPATGGGGSKDLGAGGGGGGGGAYRRTRWCASAAGHRHHQDRPGLRYRDWQYAVHAEEDAPRWRGVAQRQASRRPF